MKKIVKIFGLPKTGTNVLQLLLSINCKNYVTQLSDHGVHYLGWKHGVPLDINTYKKIEEITQEKVMFVFTIREYSSWEESILNRHQGTWEFPHQLNITKNNVFYNTPHGPEFYNSLYELYVTKNSIYRQFVQQHNNRSVIVNFNDLKDNQKSVVAQIKEKLGIELVDEDNIFEIKKMIDASGRINDYIIK